jgi:hypothetical protein
MHKLILSIALLGLVVAATGCSDSAPDTQADKVQAQHAADNASPAAQNAQAAPVNPSIDYPGMKKKHPGAQ